MTSDRCLTDDDTRRRFTVEQQLIEQTAEIVNLRADLTDAREMVARLTIELMRLGQRNDALQWALVSVHKDHEREARLQKPRC